MMFYSQCQFCICVIVGIVYYIIIFDVHNHVNNFFEFRGMVLASERARGMSCTNYLEF